MRVSGAGSVFFALTSICSALQVTPNSPCTTQCIDNLNDNPTDPNSSNTYETDITCSNSGYNTTTVGQKFKSCINCLQNSAYTGSAENDQAWFLYNLRYAVDWCLYGYPSNGTGIGGPCSTPSACGPLSTALKSGIINPSGGSTYGYCSADNGAFLGQYLAPCTTCLFGLSDNSYLSNFLVALQAGCNQQPTTGTVIGLNDTVFTPTQVAITTASVPSSTGSASAGSSALSTGAKVGIAIGCLIALVIIIAVSFIWWKKRQRKALVESRYDPRFGAPEITAPNAGAFNASHQISPTTKTFVRYNPREYNDPETSSPGELDRKSNSPASTTDFSSKSGSHPPSPPYTGATIPVHQAYKQALRESMSADISSPPNSAPIRTQTTSNAAADAIPPNSAPIRSRNFSTPTGAIRQSSQGNSPVNVAPSAVPPYDPSTYVPRFESGTAQARQWQPTRSNVPAPLRHTPGRSQAWNTESSNSVELWPGSM